MKSVKLTLGALFFLTSTSLILAQEKQKDAEKDIEGVNIRAVGKKSTESNIISVQKRSVEVVERVGAVQLDKQGVGDVATAVTKATGTQKDEGTGTMVVRGLGDRTISTTLNGLPIPSNDPEYRNIDLGIFKTNLVEYIGIEKIFNPRMDGNMAGANIDIISKEHTGKPVFKVNLGSSVNSSIFNKNSFKMQYGPDYFGFNIVNKPSSGNTAYKFTTSWRDREVLTPINSSLGLEFGRTLNIGQVGKLNIFGYGGFSNDYYQFDNGISRTYPFPGYSTKDFIYSKTSYSTGTTGLVNMVYRINPNHRIKAVFNYINSTEQTLKNYKGHYVDVLNDRSEGFVLVRRAEYKMTNLLIGQLGGENKLNSKLSINWNIGANKMNSKRPDRMQNISRYEYKKQAYSFSNNSVGDNNRYFDNLDQLDFVGTAQADYTVNPKLKISLGVQGNNRQIDFAAIQYNFKPNNSYTYVVNPDDYDQFFNQNNYAAGLFSIITMRGNNSNVDALKPQTYNATLRTLSGFGNVDYKFSENFVAQLGLRFDNINRFIKYDVILPTFGTSNTQDLQKFLPTLNMKYTLNDKNNLRLSASKTYTLPIIKEIAPFPYEDIDHVTFGNPYSYPADNYNADIKWEFFPKSGEVISINAFGKYIQNPISRINLLSAASTQSYVNIGDTGHVYGAELEIRKDIIKFSKSSKLYTFVNATYLQTKQDISNDKVTKDTKNSFFTNFVEKESKLQGASDILVNANLGLNHEWADNSMDFVISYSYVGENLYSVGYGYMGNQYNIPISLLDANLKFKFNKQLGIGFSAQNLLDPTFGREQRNEQQTVIVDSYKKGRKFGVSFSYEF